VEMVWYFIARVVDVLLDLARIGEWLGRSVSQLVVCWWHSGCQVFVWSDRIYAPGVRSGWE
jgi:hypothetical protein